MIVLTVLLSGLAQCGLSKVRKFFSMFFNNVGANFYAALRSQLKWQHSRDLILLPFRCVVNSFKVVDKGFAFLKGLVA